MKHKVVVKGFKVNNILKIYNAVFAPGFDYG